jgi:hypothetical protein
MATRRSYLAGGHFIVLAGALCLATPAFAGLKDKPPKGVELHGIWQLDPYRSDDPKAVLEKARQDIQTSGSRDRARGGGMNRGVFGGGDEPSGGSPGDARHGGGFPGGGRGGRGHGHGGDSSDDNSSGGARSGDARARADASRDQLLNDLSTNPDKLAFAQVDHNLKVSADQNAMECAAGVKVAISDSLGDAERNCGWDRRAWVIETKRGKNFTRTDRYELSQDGKTLTYTTTATGTRLPKIEISRMYTVAAAAAPGTPPVTPPGTAKSGVTD